jgi:hypothetical protein
MTDLEKIEKRNETIQKIMRLCNCSYATAAQFYYALRNYKGA